MAHETTYAASRFSTVEVIRHTYGVYEVVAWDLFGRLIVRRWFEFGARRREWAIKQAEQYAETHYLYFSGNVCE